MQSQLEVRKLSQWWKIPGIQFVCYHLQQFRPWHGVRPCKITSYVTIILLPSCYMYIVPRTHTNAPSMALYVCLLLVPVIQFMGGECGQRWSVTQSARHGWLKIIIQTQTSDNTIRRNKHTNSMCQYLCRGGVARGVTKAFNIIFKPQKSGLLGHHVSELQNQ